MVTFLQLNLLGWWIGNHFLSKSSVGWLLVIFHLQSVTFRPFPFILRHCIKMLGIQKGPSWYGLCFAPFPIKNHIVRIIGIIYIDNIYHIVTYIFLFIVYHIRMFCTMRACISNWVSAFYLNELSAYEVLAYILFFSMSMRLVELGTLHALHIAPWQPWRHQGQYWRGDISNTRCIGVELCICSKLQVCIF